MFKTRYRRIIFFFARLLSSLALWEIVLPRLGLRGLVQRTRADRLRKAAVQFRALAIQMGGVLIKVGQFLSARVDVLPPEFIAELEGLQDEVPPEPFDQIQSVAEADLGAPLHDIFLEFDPQPLAAASLGQVHRALLPWNNAAAPDASPAASHTGKGIDVVVKIQRPQIEQLIATDLAALTRVGGWVKGYGPIRRRIDLPALLQEFTRTLNEEIDYLAEGRNAETFAANFRAFPGVQVPKVIWVHTTRRVLTLENVEAIKITDYQAITAAGIDRGEVAQRLLSTYLKQIFEDGFFHADPHPGNLFVTPLGASSQPDGERPGERAWLLTFIDFGMVGRISPRTKAGARELLIGVGLHDTDRLIKSYQMLGMLLPGADLTLLKQASQEVFDRFWGKNMNELQQIDMKEMVNFAVEFRDLLYALPFQVPQDLIFLGRCVGILSGMCTGLDPDFNVWEQLAPFARKLIAERRAAEVGSGPKAWLDELGVLARRLLSIPQRTSLILEKAERGELEVRSPTLVLEVRRLSQAVHKVGGAIICAAFLVGSVQLYLASQVILAALLALGAVLSLIITLAR